MMSQEERVFMVSALWIHPLGSFMYVQKNALYLSVNVFCMKVLIGNTILHG